MDGDPAAVSSSEQTQGDRCFLSEFRSCVKVEVAVQAGSPSLINLTVSVNVKQH